MDQGVQVHEVLLQIELLLWADALMDEFHINNYFVPGSGELTTCEESIVLFIDRGFVVMQREEPRFIPMLNSIQL